MSIPAARGHMSHQLGELLRYTIRAQRTRPGPATWAVFTRSSRRSFGSLRWGVVDLAVVILGVRRGNLTEELPHEECAIQTLRATRVVVFKYNSKSYPVVVPNGVYVPDVWTRSLIDGLLQHPISADSATLIVEVGVGSGIAPIVLNNQLPHAEKLKYVGLDINRLACETAKLNLEINGSALRSSVLSQSNLLGELPADLRGEVRIIAANLPQIPDGDRSKLNVNDYYSPKNRHEALLHHFDDRGIGLLCDLLLATPGALSHDGIAILTMAGRCGIREIEELFTYCDMSYHIASRIIIRQDPSTSIDRFAEVERTSDFRFTFYADEKGQSKINAEDAARKILQRNAVYHDLYVIVARPLQQRPGD